MAFRSNLYDAAVVFPRRWRESEVGLKFSVDEDPAAKSLFANMDKQPGRPVDHLQKAMRMTLIISGVSDHQRLTGEGSLVQRSIPVCDVSDRDVEQLVVVCNAAQMITSKSHRPTLESEFVGVDIDVR